MAGLAADGVPQPHEELGPSPDRVSGFTNSRTITCCWVSQRQAQGRDATVCTLLGGAGHSADTSRSRETSAHHQVHMRQRR